MNNPADPKPTTPTTPNTSPVQTKTKVRIRNYQAIADGKLEIEGLTVVTGRSNLGKSALVRGISAVLFGVPGEFFIKRGEDWTGGTVAIEDPKDPLKITWRKVTAKGRQPNLQPVVEINGKANTKIGRDHKQLTAPYGIIEIETSQGRLRPQVAMQHDAPFLVGENETVVAEVFKILGRVDVITEAQRLAKKDLADNEGKRKIRLQDREEARKSYEELSYVQPLRVEFDQLEQTVKQGQIKDQARKRAIDHLRTLKTLQPQPIPAPPPAPTLSAQAKVLILLKELVTLVPQPVPFAPPQPQGSVTRQRTIQLLRELKLEKNQSEGRKAEIAMIDANVTVLEADRARMEVDLKICPTCGRSFDGHDHLP